MKPSIGRIVQYTLTPQDADEINTRRQHAQAHIQDHRDNANGVVVHVGNAARSGDVYPLVITRVWGSGPGLTEETAFNGQLLLDGNDTLWITSTSIGEGQRKCAWPERV